ncbi:unnamed protein product [Schistosoma turkestanicum]|nr:unnamed protein product [Schistosoma turkestanicum]
MLIQVEHHDILEFERNTSDHHHHNNNYNNLNRDDWFFINSKICSMSNKNHVQTSINCILIYLTLFPPKLLSKCYKTIERYHCAYWLTIIFLTVSCCLYYEEFHPGILHYLKKSDIITYIQYIYRNIHSYIMYVDDYIIFPGVEAMQTPAGFPKPPEYFTSYEQMIDYLAALNQYYQVFGRSRYG